MAILTFTSASGAPGVTTTILGLAMHWPRPVVIVDADPSGGAPILSGFLQARVSWALSTADAAVAARNGQLAMSMSGLLLPLPDSTVKLLSGVMSHHSSGGLTALWPALLDYFRGPKVDGIDVLIDAGRTGMAGAPTDLVGGADLTLLCTRSTLPAAVAAHYAAVELGDAVTGHPHTLQALVIGPGRGRSTRTLSGDLGLHIAGEIAWDPVHAEVYSLGVPKPRKFGSSPLARSLRDTAQALFEATR